MTITIMAIINNSNDDGYNNHPTASTAKSTKAAGCQLYQELVTSLTLTV